MTTVLLADHHSLFRAGMVELTHSIGGFTIAGEVDSAESAVEFVAKHTRHSAARNVYAGHVRF